MASRRFATLETIAFAVLACALVAAPFVVSAYQVSNLMSFLAFTLLSMSLALIWGCVGIFSFGQVAFFGIGGYAYGIIMLNVQHPEFTFPALLAAVLIAGGAAALLGYFIFYGGVNDVFVGITTLAVTLVIETFMQQTAGSQWHVGQAQLGGYNGMTGIPPLALSATNTLGPVPLYVFAAVAVIATYLLLRFLLASRWGRGLRAIEQHRERTESFGYDVRLMQLGAFALAGCIAGLGGALYAIWGGYITPSTMGLSAAALPVIMVAAGGRSSLIAAMISTLLLQYFSQSLSSSGSQYALVILGVVLVVVVVFVPDGFVVALFRLAARIGASSKPVKG
ncbi:MAG TPA: urea ABC transporter permease [Candidatus Limnocylindria bacterium]|jgi:ABC-type branched-subunit amino acid transport system permease subunit|nr:urea ABC transporter permease [Candidatus Limnocylindria bacterium]